MTATQPKAPRDPEAWAHPVERLATTATSTGMDTVTGRRVAGPVQGFGQMWQKTVSVRLDGSAIGPEDLIAHWKEHFQTFWPKGSTFYAPLSGIKPGEVALLDVQPVPGTPLRMSTGVMVIYADQESFTFMTPEGHALSAWITFSAFRDGDSTVAQVQALERTADPFIELTYMLGVSNVQDRFWVRTLENLARSVGVLEPDVQSQKVCVDRRRQWRYVRNLRFSAALLMPVGIVTAPARWLRRRAAARTGGEG
jgi:hypothetical protein